MTRRISWGGVPNWIAILAVGLGLSQSSAVAMGREPSESSSEKSVAATDEAVTLDGPALGEKPTWIEALRAVLLTAIPDKYEDRKHWGMTTDVVNGLKVKQHGLDVRISKRTKSVNHGSWYKYQIKLLNPLRNLRLTIDHLESHGLGQFAFEIHMTAKMRCLGQFEQWVLGVKGLNFPVVSDAVVQIHAQCELAIQTERRDKCFFPDLVLVPSLRRVKLKLKDVDTHRIGEIRGDLAEDMGDRSRHFIENLLQGQEPKVLKKANAAIAKKRESLRFPASKLW